MAEGDRTVLRKARQKAERTDFLQKVWCFVWGHDPDYWEFGITYHFDPPIPLGGETVSEMGPVPQEERWCRRCGKLIW